MHGDPPSPPPSSFPIDLHSCVTLNYTTICHLAFFSSLANISGFVPSWKPGLSLKSLFHIIIYKGYYKWEQVVALLRWEGLTAVNCFRNGGYYLPWSLFVGSTPGEHIYSWMFEEQTLLLSIFPSSRLIEISTSFSLPSLPVELSLDAGMSSPWVSFLLCQLEPATTHLHFLVHYCLPLHS